MELALGQLSPRERMRQYDEARRRKLSSRSGGGQASRAKPWPVVVRPGTNIRPASAPRPLIDDGSPKLRLSSYRHASLRGGSQIGVEGDLMEALTERYCTSLRPGDIAYTALNTRHCNSAPHHDSNDPRFTTIQEDRARRAITRKDVIYYTDEWASNKDAREYVPGSGYKFPRSPKQHTGPLDWFPTLQCTYDKV